MEAPLCASRSVPAFPSSCAGTFDVDLVVVGIPIKKYPNLDGSKFWVLASAGERYTLRRSNQANFMTTTRYEIDGQRIGNGEVMYPASEHTIDSLVDNGAQVQLSFAVPNRTLTDNPDQFSFQGQGTIKVEFTRVERTGPDYVHHTHGGSSLAQVETRLPATKKHLVPVTTTFQPAGAYNGLYASVTYHEKVATVEIQYRSYAVLSEMALPGFALVGVPWPTWVRDNLMPAIMPQRQVFPQITAPSIKVPEVHGLLSKQFSSDNLFTQSGIRFSANPLSDLNAALRPANLQVDPNRNRLMPLVTALASMIFGDSMNTVVVDSIVSAQRKRFEAHYKALDRVRNRTVVDLLAFTDALQIGILLYSLPVNLRLPLLSISEVALEKATGFALGILDGDFVPLVSITQSPSDIAAGSNPNRQEKEKKPEITPPLPSAATRRASSSSAGTTPKKPRVIDLSGD